MATEAELETARDVLTPLLRSLDFVTGIDIGIRDEETPEAGDLALRIFVSDIDELPAVNLAIGPTVEQLGVPFVVRQRVFRTTALPDTMMHRPVTGGVSVSVARLAASPSGIPVGTLGAIARTTATPTPIIVGVSNHHVLCVDSARNFGDEIIQPEPMPFLGRQPGDRIGTLLSWAFPEIVPSGTVDAAICSIEQQWLPKVEDIGFTAGTTAPARMMQVTKRGRTTGQTFGWISGTGGTYWPNYPMLPPVGFPPTTRRELTDQIQIHIDFPLSIVFAESGDSGSVVLETGTNRVVALFFASGSDGPGDPINYGVASPIATVESELKISFTF